MQPDTAYFGQKDAQQGVIIKKMVKDLNIPVKIKVMPIVREADGLAMSSRNVYLNSRQRLDAVIIYQSLQKARGMIARGERNSRAIITRLRKEILKKKSATIDYIAVVDAKTLEIVKRIKGKVLIGLAVWIGRTRLIDNIVIG